MEKSIPKLFFKKIPGRWGKESPERIETIPGPTVWGWTARESNAIYAPAFQSHPQPIAWVFQVMTFGTWLLTIFRGRFVGKDEFGNRYYRMRRRGDMRRERRWVIYKGSAEGSKTPPMWHAWLSHTINEPPFEKSTTRMPWRQEHAPNPTGTPAAYQPHGTLEKITHTAEAYEAWRPN